MAGSLLIYGATGYTGKLVSTAAAARGLRPILAGRNAAKLEPLAASLGLEWRAVALDRPRELDQALAGIGAVLHLAGPFSATSRPMLDACLRTGVHYLDITGEIEVFEACAARDAEARAAGIMVMPGVGFDVVPSDCLAAYLAEKTPGAIKLTLAIAALVQVSRGTAATAVEGIGTGLRVRRGGRIVSLPGTLTRDVDFGDGPAPAVALSWGDVASAYHSTGIPDITVFFRATRALSALSRLRPGMRRLLSGPTAQRLLKRAVRLMPEGPGEKARAQGRAVLIGEVEDADGRVLRARQETPDGYALTVTTSLAIAERVLAGQAKSGFQTPSRAFGADFVLGMPGVLRRDL